MILNKLKSVIRLYKQKLVWKKNNKHNKTSINMITDLSKIVVGNKSYGPLNVYTWGAENEFLEIGNYVSIANDVKFILGGNHKYTSFSTYPFKVMIKGDSREAYSNGKIILEDDVWIGMNSIIMSGVKVGKGAIVAAGSVVTKDVAAYSIVGGNPCRFIKYRFEKELIDKIINLDFKDLELNNIVHNIDFFYEDINKENIDKFKKLFLKC